MINMIDKEYYHQYYLKHKKKIKKYNQQYYLEHRSEIRTRQNKYMKDYYKKHIEKYLGSNFTDKLYHEQDKDKFVELLENEVKKINNYKKRKSNIDYSDRDYMIDHTYYNDDYTRIIYDGDDENGQ